MNGSSPARASNSLEPKRPFTSASEEFKIVRLRGAPYDMGYQQGRFLRHEIHYGIEHCAIKGTIEHFGWDRQAVDAFCASLVQGFPARVIEELRGVADGAEARWEDVLVWNLIDDYWECCQCTAFAAHDLDCGTLYGRNNDWIDDGSSHISVLVSRVPDHGAASISATWAGQVGTYEGFSSHGLAIGCQLISTQDRDTGGRPIKLLGLEMLEQADSIEKAVDIVRRSRRSYGFGVLIADVSSSVVLEATARKFAVRQPEGSVTTSANCFCDLPPEESLSYLTRERASLAESMLRAKGKGLTVRDVQAILCTFPIERPGPQEPSDQPIDIHGMYSIRSTVFELNRRVAHVAHGHLPSGHGAFVAVDLAEVFSQPHGMATVPYPPKAAAGPGASITTLAGSLS